VPNISDDPRALYGLRHSPPLLSYRNLLRLLQVLIIRRVTQILRLPSVPNIELFVVVGSEVLICELDVSALVETSVANPQTDANGRALEC
jgi:hypothetical protein